MFKKLSSTEAPEVQITNKQEKTVQFSKVLLRFFNASTDDNKDT